MSEELPRGDERPHTPVSEELPRGDERPHTPVNLVRAGLTEDQRQIADMVAKPLRDGSDDPMLGADLGWFGIGLPTSCGGGGDLADLAVVVESVGAAAAACTVGWTTGVVGATLATAADPPARQLEQIAAGACAVALPVLDVEAAAARMDVDGGALTGTLLVHGAPDFSLVAVPFTDGGDPAVALVAHEDVVVEALPSIDPSVHVARVVLDAVTPARQVVARGSALHDTWRQRVCTVAALEAVGAARTALARTLDYALTRAQFGRRIGSFQAYKHRCSSAYVELKLAQSLAFRAAAEPDTPSGRALALAAGVESTRAAVFVCGEAIQLHGGIGFSWESGLHRLLKRARTAQLLAVDSDAAAADLIRTTALVSAE